MTPIGKDQMCIDELLSKFIQTGETFLTTTLEIDSVAIPTGNS